MQRRHQWWQVWILILVLAVSPAATLAGQLAPTPSAPTAAPIVAAAKHKHGKQPHKHKPDNKAHHHKHHKGAELPPVDDVTDPVIVEPDPTPEATAPADQVPKRSKKERRAGKAALTASALTALPAAPAQDARMIRYYGVADDTTSAFFPWQFGNGFDKIEDAQRPVNGKSSHWIVTNCGPVCGWDVWAFRTAGGVGTSGSPTWAEFELNRPSMLGYVVRDPGGPPAWLAQQGWTDAGIVDARNPDKGWTADPRHVYVKDFPAGRVAIPGPSNNGTQKILPWILFAEAGGAAPTMPAGYTPNQLCTFDPHTVYKSRDGFPTWHPNHDPKSWCYFGHEHGSDPSLIFGRDTGANMPNYGQIATIAGMDEALAGFKGYAILVWPEADYYIVHHFGTAGLKRLDTCQARFHTVEVSAMNKAHTQLLYKVRFMADFGTSSATQFQDDQSHTALNPPGCPNGNDQATAEAQALGFHAGDRLIPVGAFFAPANEAGNSYEPWRCAVRYAPTLGLTDCPVFNTVDPMVSVRSATDFTQLDQMDRSGTGRFFTINQTTFGCPNLPATQRNAQGYWWTDPMGLVVYDLASRPATAVRQYCLPGWTGSTVRPAGSDLSAHLSGPGATTWGDAYIVQPGGVPGDFERSIADLHRGN